jgi:nicotinate-nucleotide adenylyltransferase
MSKRVGVFGGAFDPPHNGHLNVITSLLHSKLIDEVWLTPSGDRNDKISTVSYDHRLTMCQVLISEAVIESKEALLHLCDLERHGSKGTLFLMRRLKSMYPDSEFYFVIGSDLLATLPKWINSEALEEEVTFLVIKRGGYKFEDTFQKLNTSWKLKLLESPFTLSISSSKIRHALKSSLPLFGILPPAVREYVIKNGLYVKSVC